MSSLSKKCPQSAGFPVLTKSHIHKKRHTHARCILNNQLVRRKVNKVIKWSPAVSSAGEAAGWGVSVSTRSSSN